MIRLRLRFVEWLIALSKRTPYFDIYNEADDSLYMGRDWLMPRWMMRPDPENDGALKPKPWVPAALRLHHIVRADLDRHFHDHPSTFVSIVLRGGVRRTPSKLGGAELDRRGRRQLRRSAPAPVDRAAQLPASPPQRGRVSQYGDPGALVFECPVVWLRPAGRQGAPS